MPDKPVRIPKSEMDAICEEARGLQHMTDINADYKEGTDEDCIWVIIESFLANDDGSRVERARGVAQMTTAQFLDKAWIAPDILMGSFQRAIHDKHQGYTRYATPAEVQAYLEAKVIGQKEPTHG